GDHSGDLVPQDLRLLREWYDAAADIPMIIGVAREDVGVRTAEPDRLHRDQHLVRRDGWNGDVPYRQPPDVLQYRRTHGGAGRDRSARVRRGQAHDIVPGQPPASANAAAENRRGGERVCGLA